MVNSSGIFMSVTPNRPSNTLNLVSNNYAPTGNIYDYLKFMGLPSNSRELLNQYLDFEYPKTAKECVEIMDTSQRVWSRIESSLQKFATGDIPKSLYEENYEVRNSLQQRHYHFIVLSALEFVVKEYEMFNMQTEMKIAGFLLNKLMANHISKDRGTQ